jgi:zinc-ribbon domain
VYCPRCGTPNEAGDRYCSACGTALSQEDSPAGGRSARERLGNLVGTTRRARAISTATALAVVVAIVAFIALDPDDGIPRDDYTLAAERICLNAKREIYATGQRFRAGGSEGGASAFARDLLPAVSSWRLRFAKLEEPADRSDEAAQLATALGEVERRIAKLARAAETSDPERVVASAGARADEASTKVEEAVSSLGLDECASVLLGVVPDEN